ncbi:MAG: hypothetical protein QM726_26075 [Chitinophagaceae bacterium]
MQRQYKRFSISTGSLCSLLLRQYHSEMLGGWSIMPIGNYNDKNTRPDCVHT